MFRVAVIRKSGKSEGKSFKTVELCYNFLLEEEYKRYKILNIETNKIVESYPN